MNIVVDLSAFAEDPLAFVTDIASAIGAWWFAVAGIGLAAIVWSLYVSHNKSQYFNTLEHVLLAIDVPKENEQNLKAVEQIFASLHAVEGGLSFYKRNILGKIEDFFSMEIVSIDGRVQFVIRTQAEFRDLVESAVYAQYSDAVIEEIEDYTNVDVTFPSEEFELWGTTFKFYNKNPYPIRTHIAFEHGLSQSFVDPMASILEVMSNLRRGEQIWLQMVITPTADDWIEEGNRIVKKLIDEKVKTKSRFAPIGNVVVGTYQTTVSSLYTEGESPQKKEKDEKNKMQQLTPGQRGAVEAIEMKGSKLAFRMKMRLVYIAEKGIYSKARGAQAMIGGLKQFNTLDLNGFTVDKLVRTQVKYLFKARRLAARQRRILLNYRKRTPAGENFGMILNIEELATIYHFPLLTVKAPTVEKTEAKRSEPPTSLPLETSPFRQLRTRPTIPRTAPPPAEPLPQAPARPSPEPKTHEESSDAAPGNLPFV